MRPIATNPIAMRLSRLYAVLAKHLTETRPKNQVDVNETEETSLLYLDEVAKRTGISMPTLQRYKKLYAGRIPSVGEGRRKRYPESALEVFKEIKEENLRRRVEGGGEEAGREPTAKSSVATTDSGEGLLTLEQIGKLTGISYPKLLRFTKTHLEDIPHQGTGRARRYKPEAVAVFKDLQSRDPRLSRKQR